MCVAERQVRNMRRVLEELYHGNINPNVKAFIKNTEYSTALATVSKNENALTGMLLGKEHEEKLFEDLMKAHSVINGITAAESFIEGFRLGVRMGVEVMDKSDGCFVDIG